MKRKGWMQVKRIVSLLMTLVLLAAALPAAHAVFTPRTSYCKTPEKMTSAPPNLPEKTIPSSYIKGSLLSVDSGWKAYGWMWNGDSPMLSRDSTDGEDISWYEWVNDEIAAVILEGDTTICLEGERYGDYNVLEVYENEEPVLYYILEAPMEGELKRIPYFGDQAGEMLLLPDGTLLVLTGYGDLYSCNTRDYDLQKVTDTAIAEFVYHDGMIYFSNYDDTTEYKGVYCEELDEYEDLRYPKLYRMRIDGSGIEKLTDCGVFGLASQGNMILYQNLDEAFVFPIEMLSGPDFLSGKLYRYDTETGEHRALGIESNQYIPTPYGLAVWYNEFNIEPYDVGRADLVLHDYDGNPLYKLDAGVVELFGSACVTGKNIEFCGSRYLYTMTLLNQDTEHEFVWEEDLPLFSTVPLDGSKKTGGVPEALTVESGEGDDDWYDDEWEDYDWFDDDEEEDDSWAYVYPGMFTDGWPAIDATLNQRMATRTGPGTKFTEDHGTLPEDTEVVVYAKEEDSGGTTWVMVEFVRNHELVRAYTGLKRIDAYGDIPTTTKKPKAAVVTKETKATYGPDATYMALPDQVAAGTEVLVYGVDRRYALIEYSVAEGIWIRSWVPDSCIAFK